MKGMSTSRNVIGGITVTVALPLAFLENQRRRRVELPYQSRYEQNECDGS